MKKVGQRLLLLSDLWGKRQSDWLECYQNILKPKFEIQKYDICALGNIDLSVYEEDAIHQQFVNGGIERAVENLLAQEKVRVHVLAFSMGGTIAWKAIQQGLKVDLFYAVSATRLRYESEQIGVPTQLFYGEMDTFKPDRVWFKQMQIPYVIFANEEHECYRKKYITAQITRAFLE